MQGVFCYPIYVNTAPHKLTDIDEELRIAYCFGCNNLVKIRRGNHSESVKPAWRCANKHKETLDNKFKPYKAHKKDICENPECTATIIHPRQLSVDHMDGDRNNNDPSNLQTLCLNCHAHKSFLNNDYVNKYN